jgi:hypothetical protein
VSTNAEKRLQVSIIANYYDQFLKENRHDAPPWRDPRDSGE